MVNSVSHNPGERSLCRCCFSLLDFGCLWACVCPCVSIHGGESPLLCRWQEILPHLMKWLPLPHVSWLCDTLEQWDLGKPAQAPQKSHGVNCGSSLRGLSRSWKAPKVRLTPSLWQPLQFCWADPAADLCSWPPGLHHCSRCSPSNGASCSLIYSTTILLLWARVSAREMKISGIPSLSSGSFQTYMGNHLTQVCQQ